MNFTPADEKTFHRIFSDVVPKSNQDRLYEDELARGPWKLRFTYNGKPYCVEGNTKSNCRALALLTTNGDDFESPEYESRT